MKQIRLDGNNVKAWSSAAGFFLLHSAVAMVGASIVGALVVAAVYSIFNDEGGSAAHNTNSWIANLMFGAPGLILGFLVNRKLQQRSACWVWVTGVAWIGIAISDSLHTYRLEQPLLHLPCSAADTLINSFWVMDSSRCGGASQPLYGVFFTIPALSAITYSIGAAIAIKSTLRSFHTLI